jgi:ribosomal subunit interface protein
MTYPVKITFRGLSRSEAVETFIRRKAAKLDRFHDRIQSCQVAVEVPEDNAQKGGLYRIAIAVKVPGRTLLANRAPGDAQAHEDAYVALRDAFDAIARQLEDEVRVRRGDVKHHDGSRSRARP